VTTDRHAADLRRAIGAGPAILPAAIAAAQRLPPPRPSPINTVLGPPPDPLLPPAPLLPATAPNEAHTTPQTAPRKPAGPAPAPPEINIHIGRLHVVAEQVWPEPARPRPRRSTTTLSDYLRGKEGGT
jgi:hypothetical protein